MAIDIIPNYIAPKISDGITSLIAPATTFFSGGAFAPRSQAMDQNLQDIIKDQIATTGKTSGIIGYSDFDKSQAPGTEFPDAGAMARNFFTGKMSPSEFANATTLGRLTYDVDPNTGKVTFGSNVYDFRPEVADQDGIFGVFANMANERARTINPNITIPVDTIRGFARDFSQFDQARMGGTRQPPSFRSLNDPDVYGEIDQSRELEGKSLRDLFENVLNFLPLGENSLSGILLNALQGGKDKLTGFRDAVARRFNIRTGMQEPRGAIGRGGYGVSRPGNTLTDQTRANRAEFSNFYSNFQGGAQHQMGRRVDDVINRTAQGRRTRSDAQAFVNKYGSQEQKDKFNQAKAPKAGKGSFRAAQDEGTTGSSKIVCTMMNKSYGFGSFRNKIWMKFHKNLSPEYQKGYHKIFLPLVKIAKKNKIVKKILEHIAVHSTIDMRQSMRGKKHLLGRLYRKIILPICYWAGKK